MSSPLLRDGGEVRSVEVDAIDLAIERGLLRGCEVELAAGFVDAVERSYFPISAGKLGELAARDVVEVEVTIACRRLTRRSASSRAESAGRR